MTTTIIAQNLNTATESFAAAVMGGDAEWLRDLGTRLSRSGIDALDLCVSSVAPDEETEVRLLDWAAQLLEACTEIPLSLDSARVEVLLRCRRPRRTAPILNSVACDRWRELWDPLQPDERRRLRAVVQLRRDEQLPQDVETRWRWTEELLEEFHAAGVAPERVWIDPVCLPWGEDLQAGQPLMEYLRRASRRWPELGLLVAVGNLSWGHSCRSAIHLHWGPRLRAAGANAFLLDPFEPGLLEAVRG